MGIEFEDMQREEVGRITKQVQRETANQCLSKPIMNGNLEIFVRTCRYAPFRLACIVDNMFLGRKWDYVWEIAECARRCIELCDPDKDERNEMCLQGVSCMGNRGD